MEHEGVEKQDSLDMESFKLWWKQKVIEKEFQERYIEVEGGKQRSQHEFSIAWSASCEPENMPWNSKRPAGCCLDQRQSNLEFQLNSKVMLKNMHMDRTEE